MPVVSKGGQTGIERIAANKLSRREDMALHGGVDVLPCRIFRKLEPRGVEREDHEPVVVPACVEERRTGAIVARARFARSRRAAAAVVVDANGAEARRRLPLLRKRPFGDARHVSGAVGLHPMHEAAAGLGNRNLARGVALGEIGVGQMLKAAGLVSSTSDANRNIDQGGVRIEGEKVSDKGLKLKAGIVVTVQVGKRKWARITIA